MRASPPFGSPSNWALVLAGFDDLHFNLGHFGGTDDAQEPWRTGIARLAAQHPHVYAEVSNHRIDRADVRTRYVQILERVFADPATAIMADRLM
ncbi:MAG TPA: hypothetical protein VK923_17830, partial [Euzebyales bacterium]|nr:hypothetical protein [Euzebyales bacterium]